MAKIKGDLARTQRDLRDAKTGADAEIVARIELESIVQTKDDEINFLKNMYEEKIRQVRQKDKHERGNEKHRVGKADRWRGRKSDRRT